MWVVGERSAGRSCDPLGSSARSGSSATRNAGHHVTCAHTGKATRRTAVARVRHAGVAHSTCIARPSALNVLRCDEVPHCLFCQCQFLRLLLHMSPLAEPGTIPGPRILAHPEVLANLCTPAPPEHFSAGRDARLLPLLDTAPLTWG